MNGQEPPSKRQKLSSTPDNAKAILKLLAFNSQDTQASALFPFISLIPDVNEFLRKQLSDKEKRNLADRVGYLFIIFYVFLA